LPGISAVRNGVNFGFAAYSRDEDKRFTDLGR
jgi:hypothetical protein